MRHRYVVIAVVALSGCNGGNRANPDFDSAHSFVHESHQWSQTLTHDGEKIGHLLSDLLDGTTTDTTEIEAALSKYEDKLGAQIDKYRNSGLPRFDEISAYRKLLIEYLEWQKTAAIELFRSAIPIAMDTSLPRDARARLVVELASTQNEKEFEWKARIEKAVDDVYAHINVGS